MKDEELLKEEIIDLIRELSGLLEPTDILIYSVDELAEIEHKLREVKEKLTDD
jgi:hypothetical protein